MKSFKSPVLTLLVLLVAAAPARAAGYIDPQQQTSLAFGQRSFWLQPWRGYLDTVPGTVMRDAVGVNFNVDAAQAPRTAELLARAGVRRARVEIPWSGMSFEDPTRLADPARVDAALSALRSNGIRPLILLNANHGAPGPLKFQTVRLTAPAAAGARSVRLDAPSARGVVRWLTGLNALDGSYKAADVLFTAVSADGTATLSKPLPRAVAAGTYPAATLRFPPFERPVKPDGSRNASFELTMNGWLQYVAAVTARARAIFGPAGFDVEIWNELSFGSDFLNAGTYYNPAPAGTGDVQDTLLRRTVAWLRDPAHGLTGVGIGNGFANESPWPSGAMSPVGLTALDKHLYAPLRDYPSAVQKNTVPLGADGAPDTWAPTMRAFFPEYWLAALQTEHVVRDLSPLTTLVYGTPHGRATHPLGGTPPQVWVTEAGMDLGDGRLPQTELTAAARRHILTKGLLRELVAYVNKGATAIHPYAARGSVYGLVDEGFFAGGAAGGETIDALGRLTGVFSAAQPLTSQRSLTLQAVTDDHNHVQFAGDGSALHPPLYDRDVVAFFPFQLADRRFAIPAYVMTRNLTQLRRPDLPRTDVTRWDLPAERFRLTVGGLAPTARVSAVEPLTGSAVPVTVVQRSASALVLDVPLTDSPRILLVDES